jgi:hypothetical protein
MISFFRKFLELFKRLVHAQEDTGIYTHYLHNDLALLYQRLGELIEVSAEEARHKNDLRDKQGRLIEMEIAHANEIREMRKKSTPYDDKF